MKYVVKLKPSIKKQLKRLDKKQAERIVVRLYLLADEPLPRGAEQLTGVKAYRIRVGDYRVIYEIKKDLLLVLVLRLGHRREVYKK